VWTRASRRRATSSSPPCFIPHSSPSCASRSRRGERYGRRTRSSGSARSSAAGQRRRGQAYQRGRGASLALRSAAEPEGQDAEDRRAGGDARAPEEARGSIEVVPL
jgi:hypothetical protein